MKKILGLSICIVFLFLNAVRADEAKNRFDGVWVVTTTEKLPTPITQNSPTPVFKKSALPSQLSEPEQ
jgi:hypothetical protein